MGAFICLAPLKLVRGRRSDCGEALTSGIRAPVLPGFPELAFKRSRTGKEASIERVEVVARRKEHEAARHANGNADRSPVELHCETLAWH
jgi:hypothetical protein